MPDKEYLMDLIEDKKLYKAVMWARKMIREQECAPAYAIQTAAKYYKRKTSKVAHYVGQVASRVKQRRKRTESS